ncbi:hypothetical protein [Glycomyces albidus]|uniref:Uncharacterized protein n=1 Tax=Glycomyces albidus TaxID=2656774 RepID=A0A6L5GEJ7_9ACTN|nr:hypothetical protein [Glycomyces albidus]MQM28006.1 hypothetical protein [Glycomyces albidus]
MSDTRAQALALIAAAIERAVGVQATDTQLAIAFALLERRRRRRSARAVKTLNPTLRTRRDRSVAAAFPVLYHAAFAGAPVTVMVPTGELAGDDAALYRKIIDEIGAPTTVGTIKDARQAVELQHAERDPVTIATPEALAAVAGHRSKIVVRLDPPATKRVTAMMPGTAGLPDL